MGHNFHSTTHSIHTNVIIAKAVEAAVRDHIWPLIDKTSGTSPYIIAVPGMRKGTVELCLSASPEYPDVIKFSALVPNVEKIIGAELHRCLIRGFATETQLQQRSAANGFSMKHDATDENVHFRVVPSPKVEGSAVAWAKLVLEIRALVSFIGKTADVNISMDDDKAKPAKDETQVSGKEGELSKLADAIIKKWKIESVKTLSTLLNDAVLRDAAIAKALAEAPAPVEEPA